MGTFCVVCRGLGGAEWGRQAHRPPLVGTAGVMVSLSRILTKLLLPDEHASTLIFFLVSAGLELLCFLLHLLVRRSRFVLYHTVRPRDSRHGHRAGYRVHHDVTAGDVHFVSPHLCPCHNIREGARAPPFPVPAELSQSGPLGLWSRAPSHRATFILRTKVSSLGSNIRL